jgi:hypothetical protein
VDILQTQLALLKDVKVDGIFFVEDVTASMLHGYRNGQMGKLQEYEVDKAWTWSKEVNLWTGYQNEGKSLFLNQLALIKAFTSG